MSINIQNLHVELPAFNFVNKPVLKPQPGRTEAGKLSLQGLIMKAFDIPAGLPGRK